MTISNIFVKKIQKLEEMFVVFNQATRNPYIECDPETFDDQVYIFTDIDKAKEMVEKYAADGYTLSIVKIDKKQILPFVGGLYGLSVTAIVFNDGEPVSIQLEELVKRPDIDKYKNEKIPRANPELQLTVIYLLQETRRKIEADKRTNENKIKIRDMEEEMAINLFKSKFVLAIDLSATGGKYDKDHPNFKVPTVRLSNGDSFIPAFTDMSEYQKFALQNKITAKMRLVAVGYDDLLKFTQNTKGIVLNPSGFNLPMPNVIITSLKKRYGA